MVAKITPTIQTTTTVAEVLRRWPHAAAIFFKHHTQCVGCPIAAFDTLEDVAKNYHLALEDFMYELKAAASASSQPG